MKLNRRNFLSLSMYGLLSGLYSYDFSSLSPPNSSPKHPDPFIMTVRGEIKPDALGQTLIHEHILVDFIGADKTGLHRWNRHEVVEVVLPYLKEVKRLGCNAFVDCTPAYLGKDPELLKELSALSELHIITNTGYYGAREYMFLPQHAFEESAEELAKRWIKDWEEGIGETNIRPGFIKIGMNGKALTAMEKKLIRAAAYTHLQSGLTIASHTGPAISALEQIEILIEEQVDPSAFIWVHAQNEKVLDQHIIAAQKGAWLSFDGLNTENIEQYVSYVQFFKDNGLLSHLLLSHDAGWYSPGEEGGGNFRDYATLFRKLIPALKEAHISQEEIEQLIIRNPSEALSIKIRKG